MSRAATVYDVAARAGVSIATVSRALRLPDAVRPETRRRVADAARALHYVPSGNARDLARQRTGMLGVWFIEDRAEAVVDDDAAESLQWSLYWDQVIRGIERESWRRGFAALIASTRSARAGELTNEIAGRVDALAILAHDIPTDELAVISERIPVVLVAARHSISGVDSVRVANSQGIKLLVEHLIDVHGYRRPVFIGGVPHSSDAVERFQAFRRSWTEAGYAVPDTPFLSGDFTASTGVVAAEQLLTSGPLPDVVMCANDQTALGVLRRFRRHGVRVPEDVAVTGFDGLELGAGTNPPLTTVRQPMLQIGAIAVKLLVERLAAPERPSVATMLPVDVVIRESCGCPAQPLLIKGMELSARSTTSRSTNR